MPVAPAPASAPEPAPQVVQNAAAAGAEIIDGADEGGAESSDGKVEGADESIPFDHPMRQAAPRDARNPVAAGPESRDDVEEVDGDVEMEDNEESDDAMDTT